MTAGIMPITVNRKIQMWSYQVSHSVLLFRGVTADTQVRIDLMFRSVRAMRVRQRYDSMVIDVMDPERAMREFGIDRPDLADRFIFTIGTSTAPLDYVVAGSFYLAEDDLEDFQPSSIDHREQASHIIRELEYK